MNSQTMRAEIILGKGKKVEIPKIGEIMRNLETDIVKLIEKVIDTKTGKPEGI